MSYKVVRNSNGDIVAFGPNDDNYEPTVKEGEDLTIEDNAPVLESSPEEIIEAAKLSGVSINGVMCSATKEDQNGLTAVSLGVVMARGAGSTFPDTKFTFSNGAVLVITESNFDEIYATWMPFRQRFFAAE